MAYYFIAEITIHDEKEYMKYIDKCADVFKKYNGKYLAVDNEYTVLEGDKDAARVVVIEFPNKEDFDAWYYSKDYQEIIKHRLGGALCNTVLVKGL